MPRMFTLVSTRRLALALFALVLAMHGPLACATIRPTVDARLLGKIDPDKARQIAEEARDGKANPANVELLDNGATTVDQSKYDILGTIFVEQVNNTSVAWRNGYWVNDFESRGRYKFCVWQAPLKAVTLGVWNLVPTAWVCMGKNPGTAHERVALFVPYVRRAAMAMGGDTAMLVESETLHTILQQATAYSAHRISTLTATSSEEVARDVGLKFLVLRKKSDAAPAVPDTQPAPQAGESGIPAESSATSGK